MIKLAPLIFAGILAGCAGVPSERDGTFVAAPSAMDRRIESATIEDYILALPPFEFHEETVEAFADRVRTARKTETRNAGRGLDSLFVRGDGSAPSKVFTLDRGDRLLTIQILNWEPGMSDQSMTMRRVPGGWLRGPRVEMKN